MLTKNLKCEKRDCTFVIWNNHDYHWEKIWNNHDYLQISRLFFDVDSQNLS